MSKELEAFNGICCNTNQSYPDFQKQRKIVGTALKAFEIIKKYPKVPIQRLIAYEKGKAKGYNVGALEDNDIPYTQEEYDLLKEVLL